MTDPEMDKLFKPGDRRVSASYVIQVTEEMQAHWDGFPREGHEEHDPITDKDRKTWKKTKKAIQTLEESEWIFADLDVSLKPLERKRWVYDETVDEWLTRYREARANGWKPENAFYSWRSWTVGSED